MDIERKCLELLLRRVHVEKIGLEERDGQASYKRIDKELFLKLGKAFFKNASGDELTMLHKWLLQRLSEGREYRQGIFSYIYDMADQFLELGEGVFFHRETDERGKLKLLRFRELSLNLGNELFMAALLAGKETKENTREEKEKLSQWICTPFPTFSEEYKERAAMKNMAENHFHLKGSIPVFTLNWVCLMNHVGDIRKNFFQTFHGYMEPELVYGDGTKKHWDLADLCMEAAYIRMYLFQRLNEIAGLGRGFLDSPLYGARSMEEEKLSILQDQIHIYGWQQEAAGHRKEKRCLDYAWGALGEFLTDKEEAAVAGERYFLYRCFRAVFADKLKYWEKNMLYRYLAASLRVRAEFVQSNGRRGFHNFLEYQDRKEDFIEAYPEYQEELMNLAVKSLMKAQSISTMELRIAPKNAIATRKQIKSYDRRMNKSGEEYFYVLHYIKKKDGAFTEGKPRNYQIRELLKKQIGEAAYLLEGSQLNYQYLNQLPRIRGFDTCSGEIGCRPEVFGQFYRQLEGYQNRYRINGKEQIGLTYHAGEDFLDFADGLRAVDELLRFCRLPKNSRIGHGMVLGISPENYYRMKKYGSVLEKQDILDNVSWILGFCRENGIAIENQVKQRLLEDFRKYHAEVYGGRPAIFSALKHEIQPVREAAAALEDEDMVYSDYYAAWKLRGDDPEAYKKWGSCWEGKSLQEGEELSFIRSQEALRSYYRDYHFSREVRIRGAETAIWEADSRLVSLLETIQGELRRIIVERGIFIECNPSSNYMIGVFERYDEHPMLTMYGKNLTPNPLVNLNVSINTDDSGIFQTSLEMEYGILYTALQKSSTENGQRRYTKEAVEQWLRDVNRFGNLQSFTYDKD